MHKNIFRILILFCASSAALVAQRPEPRYPPPPGPGMVVPPAPVVERPGPPPGREFLWIQGYQRWDGRGYVWVPGHYERPPRPHAVWVPHRWQHRHGQWILIEGHWR